MHVNFSYILSLLLDYHCLHVHKIVLLSVKIVNTLFLSYFVNKLALVLFSHSVMPSSLQPHARTLCPSPTPGACSNSRPSSWWCHPRILSSVIPFSSHFSHSQHQGLFKRVGSSHQVAKMLELQHQHQSFQWLFRAYFFVAQLCPTLCEPTDCSPPGSSVRGIFQVRALEWGAIALSIYTILYIK